MVEWETGNITTEPQGIIGAHDPISCAIYKKATELHGHSLLEEVPAYSKETEETLLYGKSSKNQVI